MIKIRCIDMKPSLDSMVPALTCGRVYEVSNNADMIYDKYIMVKKDDNGYLELYYRRRFVLLSDERDKKLESIGII